MQCCGSSAHLQFRVDAGILWRICIHIHNRKLHVGVAHARIAVAHGRHLCDSPSVACNYQIIALKICTITISTSLAEGLLQRENVKGSIAKAGLENQKQHSSMGPCVHKF